MSNPTETPAPAPKPQEPSLTAKILAFWAARCLPGTFGYALALLWPIALFATLITLVYIVANTGALWPLCAFVLPVMLLLLFAGPKFPPPAGS